MRFSSPHGCCSNLANLPHWCRRRLRRQHEVASLVPPQVAPAVPPAQPARGGRSCVPPGNANLPHWCRRRLRRPRELASLVPPQVALAVAAAQPGRWGRSRVPRGDTNLPHWCRRRLRRLLGAFHNRRFAAYTCRRRLLDVFHNLRLPLTSTGAGCEMCNLRGSVLLPPFNLHISQPAPVDVRGNRRLWKAPNNLRR